MFTPRQLISHGSVAKTSPPNFANISFLILKINVPNSPLRNLNIPLQCMHPPLALQKEALKSCGLHFFHKVAPSKDPVT
jgi:hypothetical protein